MTIEPARPIYLEAVRQTTFGLFHAPESADPAKAAVLICPPWGWEETASYRTRRDWAQRLARAGHPTLRLDLPGTGNSGGSPRDPNLLEGWVAAIEVAATWLRAASGSSRLAALGLGLGGLLAMESLAVDAPIDELALWAVPISGRAFVRETRAFSRLQAWATSDGGDGDSSLPGGWLEAGGFVLSSETLDALRSLDPDPALGSSLRRVLLLGRDGIDVDERLSERLRGAGAEVTIEPGRGWGTMVSHPERSKLPLEVVDQLEDWLASGEQSNLAPIAAAGSAGPARQGHEPTEVPRLELDVGGRRVLEMTLALEQPWGRAFGVLAAPAQDHLSGVCAVFLNAGAIRSIGPSRMWVEASRAWAARGVSALRVDLEGIGEADGKPSGILGVSDFYAPSYEAQVGAVLDALEEREPGTSFVLVGLCAGGYWAFRSAVQDERVRAAVLINAGALRWHLDLLTEREARKASRAFERHWWGKLVRGEIPLAKLRVLVGSLLVKAGRFLRSLGSRLVGGGVRAGLKQGVEADLDRLRDSGTRLVIAFSSEEPLGTELEADGIAARINRWPDVELDVLPGSDHTLRPISAQIATGELLGREADYVASLGPRGIPAGS